MSPIDAIIAETISKYVPNANEVEYRLGYYQHTGFNSNVGVFEFQRLLNIAKAKYPNIKSDTMLSIISSVDGGDAHIVRIHDDGTGNKVRAICLTDRIDPKLRNVEFYRKSKTNIDFDYNLRLSFGTETSLSESEITELTTRIFDGRANKGVGSMKTYRYAKRYSFTLAEFEGRPVTLTFTVVKQAQGITFSGSQVIDRIANPEEQYEIELEFLNWTKDFFEQHKDYANTHVDALLTSFAGGPVVVANSVILESAKQFVAFSNSYFGSKVLPETLHDVSPVSLSAISKYFIGAQARSLTYGLIENKKLLRTDPKHAAPYCVSDKADGQRALMFVTRDGTSYLITEHVGDFYTRLQGAKTGLAPLKITEKRKWLKFIPTGIKPDDRLKSTLYDGEVVIVDGNHFFLAFDCLVNNGKKVTQLPFWREGAPNGDRKQYLDDMTGLFPSSIISPGFVNVRPKQFFHYILDDINVFNTEFRANIEVSGNKMYYTSDDKSLRYALDGIIIQKCDAVYPEPVDGPSKWPDTYKWKPVNHTTIDFKLIADGTVMGSMIGLDGMYESFKTGYNYQRQYRDSMQYNHYMCYARIADNYPRTVDTHEAISSGDIVECRFVYGTTSYWEPVRIRRDKLYPNGQAAHDDNMNSISNPITLESLAIAGGVQKSSIALKTVNKINRAHSNAHIAKYGDSIRETHPITFKILDIACGKGQSADGWYAAGATHIVGVDNRDDLHMAIHQSDKYLKQHPNPPTTAYYHANMVVPLNLSTVTSEELSKQLADPQQFSMVICNFAIHYAFASTTDLRNFLYNVSRNLAVNGYFVGSYMKGSRVLELITDKTGAVMPQVKLERTATSVSAITVDKKKTLWKLNVPSIGASAGSFGHHVEVSVDSLYGETPSKEYLVNLDNPDVLAIFSEYGLSLVEHTPFADIDISGYKQKFVSKINRDQMSTDERYWYNLHSVFAFKKTENIDHISLLSKSWNVPRTVVAPQANATQGIVRGKKIAVTLKKPVAAVPVVSASAVTVKKPILPTTK